MFQTEKMLCSPASITDSFGSNKLSELPDYCRKLTVRDSNGTVRELIFPKSLDLDRPKRARTTFSTDQLNQLEQVFLKNQYLIGRERSDLADQLNLSETQVKVWFQNRRTKHKRDQVKQTEDDKQKAETVATCNLMRIFHPPDLSPSANGSSPSGSAIPLFPTPPLNTTSTSTTPCSTVSMGLPAGSFLQDFASYPMGGSLGAAVTSSAASAFIGGHPLAACYPSAALAAGFCLPNHHSLVNAASPACMMAIQHQFVSQFVPNLR